VDAGAHRAGWETALEAALRERLNALEVGRLDMVRAFAADAPPAKLAFYSAAAGRRRQHATRRCRAWPTCCASTMPACRRCWATGWKACLHRRQPGRRAGPRSQLTHGEVIMTRAAMPSAPHA
jgi:chromosome segregation protein